MNTRHATVGIDVGKGGIVVAFPPDHAKLPPRQWTTVTLSYDDPAWWHHLLALLEPAAVIAAEPTGHHLRAPVAAIIHQQHPAAQVWQIDHKQTERYRESYVSSAKNDRLDAIALCLLARDIAAGQPPRNVRPYDHTHESAVQRLRMVVNIHARLTKERTRTLNRLNVLAHSLWPGLPKSDTWLRAAKHGAISPAQVKALAAQNPPHEAYARGHARSPLIKLAANLPDIDGDPAIIHSTQEHIAHLDMLKLQIETNLATIADLIEHPPFALVTSRWRTLPASSDIYIAAIHVATYGRALEFDKDEFRAALGVTPKTSISGDIDRTYAARKGFRPARAAVHMWAVALTSPTVAANAVRAYYQAKERTFPAARNKLARVLWGVARDPSLP